MTRLRGTDGFTTFRTKLCTRTTQPTRCLRELSSRAENRFRKAYIKGSTSVRPHVQSSLCVLILGPQPLRQTTAMLWAFFLTSVVATASAAWPPGKEIPCARWTYPLDDGKDNYCGNAIDGAPIPMECLSCDWCRKNCKSSGYKFGMCVKQVMHKKHLIRVPCYNVFKCVCT